MLSAPGFTGAILSALKIRLPRGPVAFTVDGGEYIPEKSGLPLDMRGMSCALAVAIAARAITAVTMLDQCDVFITCPRSML